MEDDFDENEEKTETEKDLNSEDFDNFFSIPKGSIIESTRKGLFDIGDEISRDTKSIEDEISEGIQILFTFIFNFSIFF